VTTSQEAIRHTDEAYEKAKKEADMGL
jgi:hypothetical protein